MASHETPGRRGGVYVLVLVAVLTCGAIVVGALELVSAKHRKAGLVGDYWQASANAAAGLEMAVSEIEGSHDWRWARGNGEWFGNRPMPGGGTVTIEAGGVTTNAWDTVTVTAIGKHGGARAISSVTMGLQPGGGPAQIGPGVGSTGVLAYWPLSGADSSWADESLSGRGGAEERYGSGAVYPGALPGPGIITAPWFWDSSSLLLDDDGNLDSVRSIAFWFFAEDAGARQYVVERADGLTSAGEWAFVVNSGQIIAQYAGLAGLVASTSAPVSAGRWHHVVLVAEDFRTVLYLDGASVDDAGMLLTDYWTGSGLPPVRIAGYVGALALIQDPFTGSVCDLLLLEQALSSADVAALHAAYSPPGTYRALADRWGRESR